MGFQAACTKLDEKIFCSRPIWGLTRVGFLSGNPIPGKNPDPEGKKSRKIPNPGDKNPEIKTNPESRGCCEVLELLGATTSGYPEIPGIGIYFFGIFRAFFTRFFSGFSNPDPDAQDFGMFGIFLSSPK